MEWMFYIGWTADAAVPVGLTLADASKYRFRQRVRRFSRSAVERRDKGHQIARPLAATREIEEGQRP